MPMLQCYVSEDDLRTLQIESDRSGRKVEELAEAAISNAVCEARRSDQSARETALGRFQN